MGKAWEHLSRECLVVDAMWMWGGPRLNNVLDFIIERSKDSKGPIPIHSRD